MDYLQTRYLDVLIRIQRFLDGNNDTLGPINGSGTRKELDEIVASLSAHAVDQGTHTIGGVGQTRNQATISETLRDTSMRPIAEVAQAKLSTTPQFADLRLPPATLIGSQLVAAAGSMAAAAAPYASIFIAAGLDAGFLDTLGTQAAALRASLDQRTDHVRGRSGATIGLQAELTKARSVIRVMNALVRRTAAGNAELLESWDGTRRVPKKSGPTAGAGTTPTPAPVAPVTAKAPDVPASPPVSATPSAAIPAVAGATPTTQPA